MQALSLILSSTIDLIGSHSLASPMLTLFLHKKSDFFFCNSLASNLVKNGS